MMISLASSAGLTPFTHAFAEDPATVTVSGWDAEGNAIEVEVPYNPEKVVVLDLANLDILDNLELGDRIVGAPTITQQRLRYLQTLAAYIRLPFDPLDGAAPALLQCNRSPSADGGDIVVVELLELEKEPMLYIVKALMENRVLFPAGKMAVQHDGICFNSHRNRRRVRARAR